MSVDLFKLLEPPRHERPHLHVISRREAAAQLEDAVRTLGRTSIVHSNISSPTLAGDDKLQPTFFFDTCEIELPLMT